MLPIKQRPITLGMACLLSVAALVTTTGASAAGKASAEAQQRYKEDRAKCMRGETNQDRATCLKEAGAALQQSRELEGEGSAALARNRTERCKSLPAGERAECMTRMERGTATGSAQQGGILREAVSPAKTP